jgi:hypothetical protein
MFRTRQAKIWGRREALVGNLSAIGRCGGGPTWARRGQPGCARPGEANLESVARYCGGYGGAAPTLSFRPPVRHWPESQPFRLKFLRVAIQRQITPPSGCSLAGRHGAQKRIALMQAVLLIKESARRPPPALKDHHMGQSIPTPFGKAMNEQLHRPRSNNTSRSCRQREARQFQNNLCRLDQRRTMSPSIPAVP